MSRRITVLLLTASATLIATQASADRECFEDSCRVLEAAQPPAETSPAPVAEHTAEPQSDASASVAAAAPETVSADAAKSEATAEAASAAMPVVKAEVPKPAVAEVAKAEARKPELPKSEVPKPAMPEVVEVQKPKPAAPAPKVNVVRQVAPASDYSRAVAEPSRPSVAMKPSPADTEPVRLVRHRAIAQRTEPRHAAEPGYIERRRPEDARPRAAGYAQADVVPPAVYVVGGPPVAGAVVIAVPGAVYPIDARPIYMLAPNAKIISVPSAN